MASVATCSMSVLSITSRKISPSSPALPTGPTCLALYVQVPSKSPSNRNQPDTTLATKCKSYDDTSYPSATKAIFTSPSSKRNSTIRIAFLNTRNDMGVSMGDATDVSGITIMLSSTDGVYVLSGAAAAPGKPCAPANPVAPFDP